MARYARKIINSGESGWDGKANDNDQNVFDRPIPLVINAGDLANLETNFPVAQYEDALAYADYKASGGRTLAASDTVAWRLLSNWKWMRKNRTTAANTYNVVDNDNVIETTGGTSFTINLQAVAATNEGRQLLFYHSGTGTITISANGGDTINGVATVVLGAQYATVMLISDGGTNWQAYLFGGTAPPATVVPIIVAASDETTVLTTGTAKVTFRMPYAYTLTAVRASLTTVSSSGLVTVDINEGGTTILSTKLTIDQSELTSQTAATPPVISDSSLADDAEMTIDIDGAGTGAAGLKVTLIGTAT